MLIEREIEILGEQKKLIYSDEKFKILRSDGKILYEDIVSGEFTYTETDEKIGYKPDYEKALKILFGMEG